MRSKRISSLLMCSLLAASSIACFAKPNEAGGGGGGGAGAKPKKVDRVPQLAEDVLVWSREGWINVNNTHKTHAFRAGKVVQAFGGNLANIKVTLDAANDHANLNKIDYSSIPVFPTGTDAERKKRSEQYEAWAEYVPRAGGEEPETE